MNRLILIILFILITSYTYSQNTSEFPVELIDQEIIERRELAEQINLLTESCNWKERIGKKIDVFWIQTQNGDLFGHIYEYFMDCDNLRLIYWYNNPGGAGKPVDFMIENLEDDSKFVVKKKKHLKNKKKYQHLIN